MKLPQRSHPSLYAAFDRYPSAKGAALHIRHMARALFDATGGGLLCTLGDERLPPCQVEGPVEIRRFASSIPNLLERAVAWGRWLGAIVESQGPALTLVHFRDPFSGGAILKARRPGCRLVYEVNGLPSVELPHAYPHVAPRTLGKLRELEDRCLAAADLIVTPAQTIAANLAARGVDEARIAVVPNGADLAPDAPPPRGAPARYLVYVGALQPWQGVDVALKAMALLADLPDLKLAILSSHHRGRSKPLRRLARRLGVADRLIWRHQLSRGMVARWLQHSAASLAPLTASARNLDQGCCPIKVLEAMAAGAPVIASDLPSVRELIADGSTGRLVPPDRPEELARAARILLEFPAEARAMGARGRARIEAELSWADARARLIDAYRAAGILGAEAA